MQIVGILRKNLTFVLVHRYGTISMSLLKLGFWHYGWMAEFNVTSAIDKAFRQWTGMDHYNEGTAFY